MNATQPKISHTAGPWSQGSESYPIGILSAARHGDGAPKQVCLIGGDMMAPESAEENEANARLICAAPKLLDACEFVAQCETQIKRLLDKAYPGWRQCYGFEGMFSTVHAAMRDAQEDEIPEPGPAPAA